MATNTSDIVAATGDENVRKYLDMLAKSEGVKYGYATGFGNRPLESLADHPRALAKFTQTDGKDNSTSAAGRYQFLQKTWDSLKNQYPDQMPDFSPDSQDFAATALLKKSGALDDVLKGDFNSAVKKTGTIWASLPSSPYKQNKRSWDDISGYLGQEVSGGGGGAPVADEPTKQNINANLGAFKAYQSGAMSDPQQRKDFENDVHSGVLQLPKSATAKVGKPAQDVPISAVVAFNQGKMTEQQASDFIRDIDAGKITIPKGANLNRSIVPTQESQPTTLLGDIGQGVKKFGQSIVGDGGAVDLITGLPKASYGAAEGVVGGLAGMGQMAAKGIYGGASGLANMLPQAIGGGGAGFGGFGEGFNQGAQAVENLGAVPAPITNAGAAIQQIMGAPGAELHRGSQGAGAWVEDKTGSKVAGGLAASLFETAGNAAMMGLPLKGRATSQIAAAAERTRQQIIDSQPTRQPARQPAPTPAPIPEPAPVRTPAERMDADIAAYQAERAAQQPLAGTPEGSATQAEAMNAPAPLPSPPSAIPEGYSLVDLGDGVMGVRRNPEPTPPITPKIEEIATPVPEITRPDGKTYVLDDSLDLVHGSSKPDLSIDTLQITGRTDAKQSKRGRSFGGFYLTSKADEAQATGYANMAEGTPTLYDVRIKPDTKILEKTGDIMRLDDNYIKQLVDEGYGLIVGKDVRGRTEYVVLDKNAVEGMAARSDATPAPLPVPPTPRPTPVPPVPPIPEPAPIPAPRPIPEVIPEVADTTGIPLQELASAARTTSEGIIGKKEARNLLAEQAAPSRPVVAAAERLGMLDDLQLDHVTTNQAFREFSQAIKSYTASPMSVAGKAGLERVAVKADKIIEEIGATKDVSSLSQKIKDDLHAMVGELQARANGLYESLKTKIVQKDQVSAPETMAFIEERASSMAGAQHLTKFEKMVQAKLSDKSKPTYARLDDVRRELTAAKYKKEGAFGEADSWMIDQLLTRLNKDQRTAIETLATRNGLDGKALIAEFDLAQQTAGLYKSVQGDMVRLFGKQLDGNIASALKNGIHALARGDIKTFANLIKAVPESMRSEAVANGLAYAFDKNLGAINHNTFANFWNGIKRQGEANKLLKQYLPEQAYKALDDLGLVSESIAKASKERIQTGKLGTVTETLKDADTMIGKLYEKARAGAGQAIGAEAISSTMGAPGAGIAIGAVMSLLKDKPPIHLAIDKLLGSKEFRNAVAEKSRMEALRGQQ